MISPRQLLTVATLCGAAALVGSSNNKFSPFTSHDIATQASDVSAAPRANSSNAEFAQSEASLEVVTGALGAAKSSAQFSASEILIAPIPPTVVKEIPPLPSADTAVVETSVVEAPLLLNTRPLPPEAPMQLASLPPKAVDDDALSASPSLEVTRACIESGTCVDAYLWSLYERAPKVDTNKVTERIKKAIKKDGKIRNIIRTITNYVVGDFTWKDPDAAQKAGMSLKDYVIGGMDPKFKLKLARALRMMDEAGFEPAITSAFRDDYRQSIANGNKAASDSSFHGGSRRGGYGHGLAADLVSVKGENRKERLASSDALWKWIDANEKELGIGRPYRDRDPPHVGPLDGNEYVMKRAAADAKKTAAKAKTSKAAAAEAKKPAQPAHHVSGTTKRASAPSSKVSSLQTPAADR